MANHVLLNNVEHKDLKIKREYSAEFGHNVGSVLTFPTEFGDVQKEYPIFFRRDEENKKFVSVAQLGFKNDENLFLEPAGEHRRWRANYIPATVARGPFLIGYQWQNVDGVEKQMPVVHVDMDDPRVNDSDGIPVFLEHGGNSPYLEQVTRILMAIHDGLRYSEQMFAVYSSMELLEPITVDIDLESEEQFRLSGNYTISEQRLNALGGDDLEKLNKSGFLQGAYLQLASLTNIQKLIEIKNSRQRV